jgi:XTP/dITP diphosphohydrolase
MEWMKYMILMLISPFSPDCIHPPVQLVVIATDAKRHRVRKLLAFPDGSKRCRLAIRGADANFGLHSRFVIRHSSPMHRLLIATKNAHKSAEIQAILGTGWLVEDLTAHPEIPSPEENGTTFEENARIKAEAASLLVRGLVLSDDSGLEVDALGGAPGVHSARYAGSHGDDAANRARLLRELAGKPQPWPARFRCAMALSEGGRTIAAADGRVEGRIIAEERGGGGFGYDVLFVPHGYEQTFGELPTAVKNELSHRARALAEIIEFFSRANSRG